MVLHNLHFLSQSSPVHIAINGKYIAAINENIDIPTATIRFENALAIPGLINSHDHLDFNCFPPLKSGYYKNYTEWGNDIHKKYKTDIEAVLKIPLALRVAWGIYKNILAGVTTVVNHGNKIILTDPLINIIQEPQSLHSVKFEKKWKWKLNNPAQRKNMAVIHTGEGTDKAASKEIDELIVWNLLKRKLIGIHAVAMNAEQAKHFHGIVWCPESNFFLLNKTAAIESLKKNTTVLFGTDSTLTGNWNIWEHLRLARSLQMMSDEELFTSATENAASCWKMNTGILKEKALADIVIIKNKTDEKWNSLFNTNPEDILMVIHRGAIRLFDNTLYQQITDLNLPMNNFYPVTMQGSVKYVEGNLPALMEEVSKYYPAVQFPFTHS